MPNPRGRRPGSGIHDGQRYSIRLSQELSQRLNDRARGRADFQRNLQGTDRTHADSQPGGHVSDSVREWSVPCVTGCVGGGGGGG
jgi:hypothetical protein